MNAVLDSCVETSLAMAVFDLNGFALISVNSAMCKLMEWDANDVQGKPATDLIRWERPTDFGALLRNLSQGEISTSYLSTTTASGRSRHLLLQGGPVTVGNLDRVLVNLVEVTDTVEMLQAAQSREAVFRRALKSSAVAAWEWDFDTRSFTLNENLDHIANQDPASHAMTGPRFLELLHPDDRSMLTNAMVRHLHGKDPYYLEVRIRHESGRYRWARLRGEAQYDAGGRPIRMAGTLDDITEEREAEMTRSRIQERLAIATSTVGISTWEVLRDGTAIWDAQTYRLYGRDPSTQLSPQAIYRESLSNHELERTRQWMVETMQSHTYSTIEFQLTWPDGEVRWLAAKGKGLTGPNGKVLSLLGVNWDITEQKRAAQALLKYQQELQLLTQTLMEQEKQTSQRLAMALHDRLGQSLAALRLNIDTLHMVGSEHPVTVEHTRRMQILMDSAMQELRDVLMDLRPPILEEQGLGAAMENEIAQHATRLAQPVVELLATGQAMQMRLPPAVEYGCFMVYREAFANSLKHARATRITVDFQRKTDGIYLTISDDGVGMDMDRNLVRPGHLGLVSMRERALSMGATLTVTSAPDEGTRVRVFYPAEA